MKYCSECKKEKTGSFCEFCNKETNSQYELKAITENIKIQQPILKMTHKRLGIKKFLKKVYIGFQSSIDKTKHPEGVNIHRTIDRENNIYKENIVDNKTKEIYRNIDEPLNQHIPSRQKHDNKS